MKLSELAEQTKARLESGDADVEIRGAAGLDEAVAGHVTFLANRKYTPRVATARAFVKDHNLASALLFTTTLSSALMVSATRRMKRNAGSRFRRRALPLSKMMLRSARARRLIALRSENPASRVERRLITSFRSA